jgi:hypothetical protein
MTHATRPLALKLVATAVALALCAAVWSGGTWSAFDKTSSSPGNSVAMGSLTLGDNDGGSALLSLSNATTGSTATSCIKVTTTGVDSHVRLYSSVTGTGLEDGLNLSVTRGAIAGTPAAGSCAGFTADANDYLGSGNGVVYAGTLAGFPQSFNTGLVDPVPGSAEDWATGEAHVYKLTVTLPTAVGFYSKTASATFSWQATSL